MNWKEFLKRVEANPKEFAIAIIRHLNPPKYAKERLCSLVNLCYICWKPQKDTCALCERGVCEDHVTRTITEAGIDWSICPECLTKYETAFIQQTVRDKTTNILATCPDLIERKLGDAIND